MIKGTLQFFLNCHFILNRVTRTIQIHQWSKIDAVIKEFYPEEYKHIYLPGNPEATFNADQSPTEQHEINNITKYPYRRLVGFLLYIAIPSRPDIATAFSTAGRFSHNPALINWTEYSGSLDISKLPTDTQSHSLNTPQISSAAYMLTPTQAGQGGRPPKIENLITKAKKDIFRYLFVIYLTSRACVI
jgi:hypothetical protein